MHLFRRGMRDGISIASADSEITNSTGYQIPVLFFFAYICLWICRICNCG